MPLLKDAQGNLGTIQQDQILEALKTGQWWAGAENSTLAMVDPQGKRVGVKFKPEEIQARVAEGFRLETSDEERHAWVLNQNNSDAAAFALGALRGLTIGASDWALNKTGLLTGEQLAAYSENSPGWSTTGEIVGAVAPAFATGGAGVLPKMGASAAKGALARTPAGLLAAGATRLETALAGQVANTALRKAAAKGAALGLEGAVYAGGQAVMSDPVLSGDPIVAEQVLTHVGLGAITGAVLGAGTSLLGSGARKIIRGVTERRAASRALSEAAGPPPGQALPSAPTPGAPALPGSPPEVLPPLPGSAATSPIAVEAAAQQQVAKQAIAAAEAPAARLAQEVPELEKTYANAMKSGDLAKAEEAANRLEAIRKNPAEAAAVPKAAQVEEATSRLDAANVRVSELEGKLADATSDAERRVIRKDLQIAKADASEAADRLSLATESGAEPKWATEYRQKYPNAPTDLMEDLMQTRREWSEAWAKETDLKLRKAAPGEVQSIAKQIREQKDIYFPKKKHVANLEKRLAEHESKVEKARVTISTRTRDLTATEEDLAKAKTRNEKAKFRARIKKARQDIDQAQKVLDLVPEKPVGPVKLEASQLPPAAAREVPPSPAPEAPPAAVPKAASLPPTEAPGPVAGGTPGAPPPPPPGLTPPTPAPTPGVTPNPLIEALIKHFPGKLGTAARAAVRFAKEGTGVAEKVAPVVGGYVGYKGAEAVGLPPWIGAGLGGAVIGPMIAARAAAISARAAETVLESRVVKLVSSAVTGTMKVVGEQGPRTAQRLAWEAFAEGQPKKSPSKMEPGEKIQDAYARTLDLLEQSSDPETFTQAMVSKFANISNASPALMVQISATAARAFTHLRETAPKLATISPQEMISGTRPRASSNEIRGWFDRVDVAFKGLPVVLERMSRGTLTPQMVETAQAVFPDSYNKMLQEVAFRISEKARNGGVIDRRFKLQLAMLGIGLDSDLQFTADNSFAPADFDVKLKDKQFVAKPGSLSRLASAYNQEKRAMLPGDRNQRPVGMAE